MSGFFSKPDIEPRLPQFCSGSLSKTDTDQCTQWPYSTWSNWTSTPSMQLTRSSHCKWTENYVFWAWTETLRSEYESVGQNWYEGLQGIKLMHISVKCPVVLNQASESIHAELHQYFIISCALDHAFQLNINHFLFSLFSLCNKSMIQACIGCKPLISNL